ncbi:MAG: hypothetical protein P8Y50_03630 [Sulfurovaceae bacterium]
MFGKLKFAYGHAELVYLSEFASLHQHLTYKSMGSETVVLGLCPARFRVASSGRQKQ